MEYQNILQYNLYQYCFNDPVNMTDKEGEWPEWAKKAVAVAAVATVVIAATVWTVSTFGAGSVAGIAAITATATMAARATEVAALQVKKSQSEGKSKKKTATNVVEAIYDNGGKIVGKTPVTKAASISANHILNVQVEKIFGGKARISTTLKATGGRGIPYAFVVYNWANTIYSMFTKNFLKRARRKGYILK